MEESRCVGGLGDEKWGHQYHQQKRVYLMGDVAQCLQAQLPGGALYIEVRRLYAADDMCRRSDRKEVGRDV